MHPPPTGSGYPPGGYGAGQPYAQPAPPVTTRPPMFSIVSPEDVKKLRTMQLVNFAVTLAQLGCSLAIILIVRYDLGGYLLSETCYAATTEYRFTCEYAYALAAVSIFCGFWLSFMQCLTMDCCGAGRAFEALFDMLAFFWWLAGAITLTVRANEANDAGVQERTARMAVVALSWVTCGLFLILMCVNFILMKRLGKAYKAAAQQMQQHNTALPMHTYSPHPQMTPAPGHYPATPVYSTYPAAWPAGQPSQPSQPPVGYPQATPAASGGNVAPYPPQEALQ